MSTNASGERVKETPKQAAMGLIISFVMVLAFKIFVFDTYVIPTGSMGPTLMGRHMRLSSPQTGFTWAVNPPVQAGPDGLGMMFQPRTFTLDGEPQSGLPYTTTLPAMRGGDRIGVARYHPLFRPSRWDVTVVKWPASPHENYIKRLVGLPGERLWLADGDVFVTRSEGGREARPEDVWEIERKPARVQRDLWWPVFSTEFTPLDSSHNGRAWRGPWTLEGATWTDREIGVGASGGALTWDESRWPVLDWAPYNDAPPYRGLPRFPVSDVRVRVDVVPEIAGLSIEASVRARGHEFRGVIGPDGAARVEMRADGGDWRVLGSGKAGELRAGRSTSVELWHVDQSVSLWVQGREAARGVYDWSPWERLAHAMGKTRSEIDAMGVGGIVREGERSPDGMINAFADGSAYGHVGVRVGLSGAARLTRVGLDRDLHYQASWYRSGEPSGTAALGTHPRNLAVLHADEYFLCGDNSANSTDSRLVDSVNPWVAEEIDNKLGVVHRRMLTGKAVVVFWPSMLPVEAGGSRFMIAPDFGRMRFIR